MPHSSLPALERPATTAVSTLAGLKGVRSTAPIHDDRLVGAILVAVFDDLAGAGDVSLGCSRTALTSPLEPPLLGQIPARLGAFSGVRRVAFLSCQNSCGW